MTRVEIDVTKMLELWGILLPQGTEKLSRGVTFHCWSIKFSLLLLIAFLPLVACWFGFVFIFLHVTFFCIRFRTPGVCGLALDQHLLLWLDVGNNISSPASAYHLFVIPFPAAPAHYIRGGLLVLLQTLVQELHPRVQRSALAAQAQPGV